MATDLRTLIGQNEKILYEGKPDKKCFFFETIFNPLLPFALIWLVFDSVIFSFAVQDYNPFGGFILVFLLFHLFPVWLYLAGIIFMIRRYRNTAYLITDNAVYIASGVFARHLVSKPFGELSHIDLHQGIFDQLFKVGDIILTTAQRDNEGAIRALKIADSADYRELYALIQKLQKDIYADIQYPNDLRPEENHGYRTKYHN